MQSNEQLQQYYDTMGILSLARDSVAPFYEPSVDYHGLESHIDYSLKLAMGYCDTAEEHGLQPNRLVVGLAIIYHDAGISHKLLGIKHQFENDEAYAAHIAQKDMESMGLDEGIIEEVVTTIGKTKPGTEITTLNEAIACQADIGNAEDRWHVYEENADNYKRELEEEYGSMENDDFAKKSRLKLGALILRLKPLSDWAENEDWDRSSISPQYSHFVVKALRNLQFYYVKHVDAPYVPLDQFVKSLQEDIKLEAAAESAPELIAD
jgi:hypothetical protein